MTWTAAGDPIAAFRASHKQTFANSPSDPCSPDFSETEGQRIKLTRVFGEWRDPQ